MSEESKGAGKAVPNENVRLARKFIDACLILDSEFEAFCIDYFPEVARIIAPSQDRLQKNNILLQIADPIELISRLQEVYPQRASGVDASAVQTSIFGKKKGKIWQYHLWAVLLIALVPCFLVVLMLGSSRMSNTDSSNRDARPFISLTINGFSAKDTVALREGIQKTSRMKYFDIEGDDIDKVVRNIENKGLEIDYMIILNANGHGFTFRRFDREPQFEWRSLGVKRLKENQSIINNGIIAQIAKEIEFAINEVVSNVPLKDLPSCLDNSTDWTIKNVSNKNYGVCQLENQNDGLIVIAAMRSDNDLSKKRKTTIIPVTPESRVKFQQTIAEVRGELDNEIIHRIVRRHSDKTQKCYSDSPINLEVKVEFVITEFGKVTNVKVLEPLILSEALRQCLSDVLMNIEFPKPTGGSRLVTHVLQFDVEGALKNFLASRSRLLYRCFSLSETGTGTILLIFSIDKLGNISSVKSEETDFDRKSTDCILNATRQWTLPYLFIDSIQVRYRYRFTFMD